MNSLDHSIAPADSIMVASSPQIVGAAEQKLINESDRIDDQVSLKRISLRC